MRNIIHLFSVIPVLLPLLVNAQGKQSYPAGAIVPFITYEAESKTNKTNGKVVSMTSTDTPFITPEMEASGRAFVELTRPKDYLELKTLEDANTIVVRFCTPDAPAGSGAIATLGLYINNKREQTLVFNSKHAWLYGSVKDSKPPAPTVKKENGPSDEKWQYGRQDVNGQSNDPAAGVPHVYWDEARFFINKPLKKGDKLKFQKDNADTASFYRIDLVDLEQVDKPLDPPASGTYLSVTDFGATGTDTTDDTEAITACIAEAKKQNKTVWMPAGTFYQTKRFVLDGIKLSGAGMWYTNIIATVEGTNWAGNAGFQLKGMGCSVSNLFAMSDAHTRRSTGGKFFSGNPDHWEVNNVWMEYGICGFWMSGAMNGVVSNCRVRNTYADAININDGSRNVLVIDNHVRGVGDDGIAVLSQVKRQELTTDITVRRNTITANWWGHNIDLAGGHGHLIDSNYMADNAVSGCFTINLPAAYPMYPTTKSMIRDNVIERGGGDRHGLQKRGAVWLYAGSTSIDDVSFIHNTILHSIFRGIHLTGSFEQNMIFENNIIDAVSLDAVFIDPQVKGHGKFVNNTIKGLKPGYTNFKNSSETFTVEK